MKKIMPVFLLGLWCCSAFATPDARFDDANAKYKAGDFKAAAAIYEEMISSGKASASVYYNLANAYFRLDKKGNAMIDYERAIRLAPRDPDARWNVAILKSILTDRIEPAHANAILDGVRGIADKFTPNEICLALTGFLMIFAALALLNLLLPGSRRWTGSFKFLIVLGWCAAAIFFWYKWTDTKESRVVVLNKEVYAHYGPSDQETKAFLLHEGAEAKVVDETPDWFYVALENKTQGWIPKSSSQII